MLVNKDLVKSRYEEFKKLDLAALWEMLSKQFEKNNDFCFKISCRPLCQIVKKTIIPEVETWTYIDERYLPFVSQLLEKQGFKTEVDKDEYLFKVSLNFDEINDVEQEIQIWKI